MKRLTLSLLTAALICAAGSAGAWWGNGWGGWNPYSVWDPRYWVEEFFGGSYYGGGPWGYGGPWGGYGYPYYSGNYGYGYPHHGGTYAAAPYYGGSGYPPSYAARTTRDARGSAKTQDSGS